jgi:thiamine-phosphate pyrophosphorylase
MTATRLAFPKLYVILDQALLQAPATQCADQLLAAGVRLVQYRHKTGSARESLHTSRELVSIAMPHCAQVIVNDRPDIAVLAGAAGVHVGQDDLDVEQARNLVGSAKWVGVSTHNVEQFRRAAATSADYIAVGPVFGTSSKANPDPIVGLALIRQVRALTAKPIVAIGGITLERAPEVIAAGADSIAVISDILRASQPGERARGYLEVLNAISHNAANQAAAV